MSIDMMGPRFYTQQMRSGTKVKSRLKTEIKKDIEKKMCLEMPSLMNVTKQVLEVIYDKVCI